jgi:hypothetical protein
VGGLRFVKMWCLLTRTVFAAFLFFMFLQCPISSQFCKDASTIDVRWIELCVCACLNARRECPTMIVDTQHVHLSVVAVINVTTDDVGHAFLWDCLVYGVWICAFPHTNTSTK